MARKKSGPDIMTLAVLGGVAYLLLSKKAPTPEELAKAEQMRRAALAKQTLVSTGSALTSLLTAAAPMKTWAAMTSPFATA